MNEMDELRGRYQAAMHAMQTGVGLAQEYRIDVDTPKHVRVGINSCQINDAAIAQVLMDKGIMTELEYMRAIVRFAEAEAVSYEKKLQEYLGATGLRLG